MNKLLICLLFLVSCTNSPEIRVEKVNKFGFSTIYGSKATEFQYKNHTYIEFMQGNATWGVHDPDCKCKK